MAIVETRQLRKIFADHNAVDGVDLATREGEFLVLLGPSGCGKTTLLRMIAGLEKQTSGDIVIGGQLVNDLPPRARKIAMVFQSYALYPRVTSCSTSSAASAPPPSTSRTTRWKRWASAIASP